MGFREGITRAVNALPFLRGDRGRRAAAEARRQILEFAAEQLGCAADELLFEDSTIRRSNFAYRSSQ
jgi:xanthine dehydrogenase molybdopterin-binding subunit B